MDREEQIWRALHQAPLLLPSTPSCTLEPLQEGVYHLYGGVLDLFVKWIADDDPYGVHELQVNQWLLGQTHITTPRLLFTSRQGAATVACWEWLDGSDLRTTHRQALSSAFSALGHFHRAQRYAGPLYSPSTQQTYHTIPALLAAELDFLGGFYSGKCKAVLMTKCQEMCSTLAAGYPTLVHGDMHPGNLRLTKRGLFFVDWGYARHTLNFFDLDYIQSTHLPGTEASPWWVITPEEANTILPAYFAACGLGHLPEQRVQLAVMAWNELRCYYNGSRHGQADEEASLQKLEHLYQAYRQSSC